MKRNIIQLNETTLRKVIKESVKRALKEYKEHIYHPAFGYLTDEDDIRIFRRQQEEEEYNKQYEDFLQKEYEKQCQKEQELYDTCLRAIDQLEKEGKNNWDKNDLAKYASVSVEEAEHIMKCLNLL